MESTDRYVRVAPDACPLCDGVMERGKVAVRTTLGGKSDGFFQQALFFIHADTDRILLITTWQNTNAYWCATAKPWSRDVYGRSTNKMV
ncbi:MAG: hypothetical protein ABI612_13765 [Betaproteobacteria bacterium]